MSELVHVYLAETQNGELWLLKDHPNGRDLIKHRKITNLIDIEPEEEKKEKLDEGQVIS